jgi:uncharacterized protein YecE (DUF72 family)
MTTLSLYVGATLQRAPRSGYFADLPFAELAFQKPLPRVGRLREWRATVPESARLSLVIPRTIVNQPRGALRFDDTSGLDWLLSTQEATRADTFVLETRAELTPGARDQEMLVKFAERLTKKGAKFVWEAGGVWQPEQSNELAAQHGWITTWDPTGEELAPEAGVYVRIHALGVRSRLSEALLATIAEGVLSSGRAESVIAIDGPNAFRKAKSLTAILSGESPEDAGGGDTLRRAAGDGEDDEEDQVDDGFDDE